MKCTIKLADNKTKCNKDFVFNPHGTKSAGTIQCPDHPEETAQEVITCHSCFRNHNQVEDWGVWLPNDRCSCACHDIPDVSPDQMTPSQFMKIFNNSSDKLQNKIQKMIDDSIARSQQK
jgi:hypothetical protein